MEAVAEPSFSSQPTNEDDDDEKDVFQWTALAIMQSILIFIIAGIAEILGGWLVWATIKGVRDAEGITHKRPWYYALCGSVILVAYGFIPCLQPSASTDGFGRICAAYGGYFIVLSFLLAWALEGNSSKPDVGDIVGGGIAIAGVFVIMFWPRR